jgi:arylsulfatase A-like enzyme
MTAKYPARLHITDWIAGHKRPHAKLKVPDWTMHLPLEEMNIARALGAAGYATASIGKWHLGGEEFYPDKQGFDLSIAGCDKGQPPSYFAPSIRSTGTTRTTIPAARRPTVPFARAISSWSSSLKITTWSSTT